MIFSVVCFDFHNIWNVLVSLVVKCILIKKKLCFFLRIWLKAFTSPIICHWSMATEMEIDADTKVNASCLTHLLKTSPFVKKRRKLCIICFSGAASKNAKRANLQKIPIIESYKEKTFKWTSYEHAYNKVYEAIDWEKKREFYARKLCKVLFCKYSFMIS